MLFRSYDERELDQVVRKIFTLLRAGRPSPIVVEVPGDLAGKDVGDYKYQPLAPQKLRSGADPASIEVAARTLIEAKRPLLYAGHGTLIAGASAELLELAELLTVPVAVTLASPSSGISAERFLFISAASTSIWIILKSCSNAS